MFGKKLSAVKTLDLVVSLFFIFVGHAAAGGLYHCTCNLDLSCVNVYILQCRHVLHQSPIPSVAKLTVSPETSHDEL